MKLQTLLKGIHPTKKFNPDETPDPTQGHSSDQKVNPDETLDPTQGRSSDQKVNPDETSDTQNPRQDCKSCLLSCHKVEYLRI